MTGRQFEYKIRDYGDVYITENYLFMPKMRAVKNKPVCVSDMRENGERVYFRTIAEALEFVLDDGRKILDVIENWTDMPEYSCVFDGDENDNYIIWHTK